MSKKKDKSKQDGLDETGLGFANTPEREKEIDRAQIRDLEKQLDRFKDKYKELENERNDSSSRYVFLEKDTKDIIQYLKRCLEEKEDELNSHSEQLGSLQQANVQERDALELQLSLLRQEAQENEDELNSKNMVLAHKLAALEEYRLHKESLMADMESLQRRLAEQKEEHDSVTYNQEAKAILNNNRLKMEMQSHLAEATECIQRKSDQNMPVTAKRAIQENVELMAQLGLLSDRIRQILWENDALMDQNKELHRQKDILDTMVQKITRQKLSNEKEVVVLKDRCQQMETELQEHSQAQRQLQQLQQLQAETVTLRQEHASVLEEYRRSEAEAMRLGAELRGEREVNGQLERTLQEAASSITEALHVPEMENISRRSLLLLKLLNSAAQRGTGPALVDFIPENSPLQQPQTLDPTPARRPAQRSDLAHYKLGDLGLVPRRVPNSAVVPSKTGPSSKHTSDRLKRKPSSQKKASSLKQDSQVPPITDTASGSLPSPHRH